jgi:ribonuclease P protein component
MKKQSFGKEEKILRKKEFSAAYDRGKRLSSANFIVFLNPNQQGKLRLGITVSKRVGKAVQRNRIKRLLREFFRVNKERLPQAQDIVIVARKDTSAKKLEEVSRELEGLLMPKEAG